MSSNYSANLQRFAEEVSYRSLNDSYIDLSDPINKEIAENWFKKLTFLSKRDMWELKEVWRLACEDGRNNYLLFDAIKVLQDKYENKVKRTYEEFWNCA
jgi:hypothetical protein